MDMEKHWCISCMSPLAEADRECPFCAQAQDAEPPPHHLKPGTVLNGKFLVGLALGEGGFGITYIGRDLTLDMKVAVKEYYPSGYVNRSGAASPAVTCSVSDEKADFFAKGRERFLQEARILAKFSSEPGIVCVRDFFQENNTAYIVMEYLDGETLRSYLRRTGPLSPQETLRLLVPVMQSLEKVHQQGLIHRDISPDNIMMADGQVKLLDFGAARRMTSVSNRSMSVLLKPGYAPEEQYRSKGEQGPWTDVYALCATMYKCITGKTPDDSNQRSFCDELKEPSALGISLPAAMEAAMMKGLAVLQKDRYQSVQELLGGLMGAKAHSNPEDKTVYMDRTVSEDDIGTVYMDERSGEDAASGPEKPGPEKTEPEKTGPEKPETVKKEVPAAKNAAPPEAGRSEEDRASVPKPSKRGGAGKILLVCAALLILAAGFLFLRGRIGRPTICGKVYEKDTTSISLWDATVTEADMKAIASLEKLTYLTFNGCTLDNAAMRELGSVSSLHGLGLKQCSGFSDYSGISKLTGLQRLSLQDCGLTNEQLAQISFSKLPELSAVCLDGSPALASLAPLAEIAGALTELTVSDTAVTDLAPLGSCGKLRILDVSGTGMRELSLPADAPLTHLSISGNQITDLSPMAGYSERLQELRAADNQISDLSALSGCAQLKLLDVSRNDLTGLEGLELSLRLAELYAADNAISDLGGLANCTMLKTVDLNHNAVSDISLLQKSAASLENLYLSGNRIEDISALSHTPSLQRLNLDGNGILTLEPLAESTALVSLSADYNRLHTAAGLENAAELQYLYLAHNAITDMSPIAQLLMNTEKTVHALDISHNSIQTLELGDGTKTAEITVLNLCANPLNSLEAVKHASGTHLLFSYLDGMDLTDFASSYSRFTVLDCPLDKQVEAEKALSNASFASDTEADELMWETRNASVTGGAERVSGPAALEFDPDEPLMQAEFCWLLWQMAGSPPFRWEPGTERDDISMDAWYAEAVGWCLEAGIMEGLTVRAAGYITRGDAMSCFDSYAKYLGGDVQKSWEKDGPDLAAYGSLEESATRAEIAAGLAVLASPEGTALPPAWMEGIRS